MKRISYNQSAENPVVPGHRQLDPALEKWLEGYNKLLQDLQASGFKQTPSNAREGLANLTWTLVSEKPAIKWVNDDIVKGDEFDVSVRLYHPDPDSTLPVLIYFHGGGHMSGSISVYDRICRKMAQATQHLVVSVDYRRAPECRYPAGINDAVTVVKNIWATLDERELSYARQLSIAGDSAGGAISATLSHRAQLDPDLNIRRQVLIYPSLDYSMQFASVDLNATGYLLHKDKMKWFFEHYFNPQDDWMQASPLNMQFSDALPETLLITAEFDPLRDEGYAYIEKLKQAGVENRHVHFNDMVHAFMNMEDVVKTQCETLYSEIGTFLKAKV
jgi:acetyl esterase/lipase